MGWAAGSELAEGLWTLVRKHIPEDKRKAIAKKFVGKFENEDCDTMDECLVLMKDAGLENRWDDED